VREKAIETYVEAVRIWNPGAGTRMALKTADPVARESRVHESFRTWLAWDPDSARQWLKGADFSEAVKTRWFSEKPNPEF
jgi:predicted phosphoadenosine phosphosulfate sulfurtransferase